MKIALGSDLGQHTFPRSEIAPAGAGPSCESPNSGARTLEQRGEMTMKLAKAPLLFTLAPAAAWARVNIGGTSTAYHCPIEWIRGDLRGDHNTVKCAAIRSDSR